MPIKLFVLSSLLATSTIFANNLNIQTLESNFKQSITNDQNAKIVYTGKMYATQAKNQALWEYNAPIVKKIYYTGGKLVIIEPELEQVIYAKLDKVPNVLKLIKSAKKVAEDTLQTRFNSITYNILIEGNKIINITYIDEMQNSVAIEFSDEKVNKFFNDSVFAYTIPADYDILEQ